VGINKDTPPPGTTAASSVDTLRRWPFVALASIAFTSEPTSKSITFQPFRIGWHTTVGWHSRIRIRRTLRHSEPVERGDEPVGAKERDVLPAKTGNKSRADNVADEPLAVHERHAEFVAPQDYRRYLRMISLVLGNA
jgi:hypothetical protein